jgi:hypothetical protein
MQKRKPKTESVSKQQKEQAIASRENAVAVQGKSTALGNGSNAWIEVASELDRFVGSPFLKFTKIGEFALSDTVVVPNGTRCIAHVDEAAFGWRKWEGGRPVDERMGRVADCFVPPQRQELGDTDQSKWETGDEGERRDPWQFCASVPFTRLDTGESCCMLYDIVISAALGRELLGGRKAMQGSCLYLALEDSYRRLRFRAEKLLAFHMGSYPNVHLATTWERVDQDGLQLIKEWVEGIRSQGNVVACVAIDVLQMIRPLGGERMSVYQRDYMAVKGCAHLPVSLGLRSSSRIINERALPTICKTRSPARRAFRLRWTARSCLSGSSLAVSFSMCAGAISKRGSSPPHSTRKHAAGTLAATPAMRAAVKPAN